MSASQAIEHRFRVGRYWCALTLPVHPDPDGVLNIVAEWQPRVPRKLSAAELQQYRAGRDDAIRALAERTGLKTAVIDL